MSHTSGNLRVWCQATKLQQCQVANMWADVRVRQ